MMSAEDRLKSRLQHLESINARRGGEPVDARRSDRWKRKIPFPGWVFAFGALELLAFLVLVDMLIVLWITYRPSSIEQPASANAFEIG